MPNTDRLHSQKATQVGTNQQGFFDGDLWYIKAWKMPQNGIGPNMTQLYVSDCNGVSFFIDNILYHSALILCLYFLPLAHVNSKRFLLLLFSSSCSLFREFRAR